jgi:tetratricopeptide (TPR) repeat protein
MRMMKERLRHCSYSPALMIAGLLLALGFGLLPLVAGAQSPAVLAEIDDLRDRGLHDLALERLDALAGEQGAAGEILWRTAWTRVNRAEESGDGDLQRREYRLAADEARRAVELLPRNGTAQMVRGISVGRVALSAGTRERIELSREVREAADEAIRLDPALDGAYHVRARWNHEVATLGFVSRNVVRIVYGGLPDASLDQALADFETAIRLNDRVIHRLELARTLLELRRNDEARSQLERAVSMSDDDYDAERHRADARRLLARIR